MLVLIDLDPMVYACGFAAQQTYYHVKWCDVVSDDPYDDIEHRAVFKQAWRKDRFIELLHLHPDEYIVDKTYVAEPLQNALHLVNQKIERTIQAVSGFLAETGEEVHGWQGFLTDGKGNFRNEVATIKPYKGNRKQDKPVHYKAIREYMVGHYDAEIMADCEADDALSIMQNNAENPYDTVICTIDKDLKMVPGFHYNYGTGKDSYVTAEEGLRFFYKQLITGDSTDNIGGVFKSGKAAAKVLDDVTDEEEMYSVVLGMYNNSILKYEDKTGYNHMNGAAALLENARLLWMQTYEGEMWMPPEDR